MIKPLSSNHLPSCRDKLGFEDEVSLSWAARESLKNGAVKGRQVLSCLNVSVSLMGLPYIRRDEGVSGACEGISLTLSEAFYHS